MPNCLLISILRLFVGLVNSEIHADTSNYALNMLDEFERERESHRDNMPIAWLLAKFRQIGLDTHTHNFTLNYPLDGGRMFTGKNVYGILRAQRVGSTESIVISTPYRTPSSIHPMVTHSIPILLAFAYFARGKTSTSNSIKKNWGYVTYLLYHNFVELDGQDKNIGQKTSFFW